jgi:hypothetical protein
MGHGNGTRKKEPPLPAAQKFKQGGVKQSGQEPLNVQKMDKPVMKGKA